MKNAIKDVFNVENAIRIYRERPLALLSAFFAVLSLYSILSLFMLADCPIEKKRTEMTASTGTEAGKNRLLSLKRKSAALEERGGVAHLPLRSAFGSDVGKKPQKPLMAEAPPMVRVKVLGERGKVRVALIDIDGEDSKLLREQDTFGAVGSVLHIDSDGVTWSWGSKEFRSSIWE